MLDLKEVHWLAGLLEGEGCFNSSKNIHLRVRVGSVDEDIIRRAQRIFNTGGVYKNKTSTGRTFWTWEVCSGQDAASIMMTIYPIMGIRRQTKIHELLSAWIRRYNV